ncbi:hypothetical protein RRG08_020022 [Elysia crispata]|uniref:Uncharacterized protein n=1 Tax=Elysia crispata TaxID=231223 RepID=A0AAE1ECX0_9GAST|nr:hypothetical protein RRG08_020022 [Elysia crispata]
MSLDPEEIDTRASVPSRPAHRLPPDKAQISGQFLHLRMCHGFIALGLSERA